MSSAFLAFRKFDKPRQMWYTKALRAYLKTVGGLPSLGESAVAISFGRRAGRIHAPGKGVIVMEYVTWSDLIQYSILIVTIVALICDIFHSKRK